MTAAQLRLLARVCQTNGGGLSTYDLNQMERKMLMKLYDADLVQGKKGAEWKAVHTNDGFRIWKHSQ